MEVRREAGLGPPDHFLPQHRSVPTFTSLLSTPATGYTDTGVTLIANKAVAGVDSKDTKVGMDLCWGKK